MNKILKLVLSDNEDDNLLAFELLTRDLKLTKDLKILCKYEGVRNSSPENSFPEIYSISKDARLYFRLNCLLSKKEHSILYKINAQPEKGKYYIQAKRILKRLMNE